jgi:TonB family protein
MAVTARQIGWDGNVTLDVVIRKNGRVGDVKVLSATNRAFERSAVDAVKRWQFAASDRDVIVTLKVAFKID